MAGVSGTVAAIGGLAGAVQGASGGGGGGGMPRWQRRAMRANYDRAQDVAGQMRVAPFNADQLAAMEGVRGFQGYLDEDMAGAQARAEDLAGGVSADDIRGFYNPFEQDVVNSFLSDLDTMRGQEDLRVNDAAEASSAFGGDREAVYRAVQQGQLSDVTARNIASLRHAGFDTAGRLAMSNHGLMLAGNDQLSQLINSRRSNRMAELEALMRSGAIQQGQTQSEYNLPVERLRLLMEAAGQYAGEARPDYDPVAGAISGFQGGYGTTRDLLEMFRRSTPYRPVYPGGGAPVVPQPNLPPVRI